MKSWKTTLFGAITACGMGLSQTDDAILKTIGQILAILGPVLMGFFAKDSTVTGGTVVQ
ncbi:hypothetical protein [Trichlorobacter lovleyi]|uniref:hypothetical protein n=1 Tax=Trichlorobacter lovleyi TaxID=313985 RepID=UPI003D1499C4